jgi:cell wall-associated NlpC family hydrolase
MLDGVSRPDLRLRAAVVLLGLLGLAVLVGRASPGFAARAEGLKAAEPPRAATVVRRERARGDPAASGPAAAKVFAALRWAVAQQGHPYVWGGIGPNGFDCSGLVMEAYRRAGIQLPRVAADQYAAGPKVDRAHLQAGDLVFFAWNLDDPASVHHVGLYLGEGWMLDAPHSNAVVRVDSIRRPDLIGATRPVGLGGSGL